MAPAALNCAGTHLHPLIWHSHEAVATELSPERLPRLVLLSPSSCLGLSPGLHAQ